MVFLGGTALGFLIADHLNLGLLKSATVSPRPPNSSVVIVTFGAGKKLGSSPLPTKQAELKGILLGINIIIKPGGRLLQSEPGCGFPDGFQREGDACINLHLDHFGDK